ncbi:hypothetical protein GTP45_08460 [Pseudoduganella sp. FT55W]|uniref:Uncharacterized protein n=1 Tax=Duganella rivi TaxID=2666083 RepID=A0A7X4GPI2_9BURK|nr:hypothetical protein [Duganella rivi]MYM66859.1 hypothetical protein [Duganella rivi]
MDKEEERRRFIGELWQRFEQLQAWAVENWPDKEQPLSSADFVEARKEILGLRNPTPAAAPRAPEPEQGGPQYIDMNPAPWP